MKARIRFNVEVEVTEEKLAGLSEFYKKKLKKLFKTDSVETESLFVINTDVKEEKELYLRTALENLKGFDTFNINDLKTLTLGTAKILLLLSDLDFHSPYEINMAPSLDGKPIEAGLRLMRDLRKKGFAVDRCFMKKQWHYKLRIPEETVRRSKEAKMWVNENFPALSYNGER